MATRLYLASSTTPAAGVTLPLIAATTIWESSASFVSRACHTVKGNSAMADVTMTKGTTVSNDDRLARIYITDETFPAATTVSGTFSAVIRCLQSNAAADFWLQFVIKVVSGDGQTNRGFLYQGNSFTTEVATVGANNQEMGTTASTRIYTDTLTSVNAQAGDRIQIEIGARGNGTTSTHSFTVRVGDLTASADFALTSGLTTDLDPWVEFSQDLFTAAAPTSLVVPSPTLQQRLLASGR